jgi:hypothetical protein
MLDVTTDRMNRLNYKEDIIKFILRNYNCTFLNKETKQKRFTRTQKQQELGPVFEGTINILKMIMEVLL